MTKYVNARMCHMAAGESILGFVKNGKSPT